MVATYLAGESAVRLWGLSGAERLARQLRALGTDAPVVTRDDLPASGRVLLLRADHVFEQRALHGLLKLDGLLLRDGAPVAAHVDAGLAGRALRALEHGDGQALPGFGLEALQTFERDLRKSETPMVAPITSDARERLEDRLYGAAYKGITDFVTKWWWPGPAKLGVRCCTRVGITPNMVTVTGLLLMLSACWLFYRGDYATGLALAWIMTYLDTVDGKLARVTAQSSRFGHFLDHGMDIVHPPFWYWLWGLSLPDTGSLLGIGESELYIALFGGYVSGRLIEALFHLLGDTSIFAWRPFDAYFRLFTARRNPCLVLLTLAWALGSPVAGLWLVVGWTVLSTLVMLIRLLYGVWVRLHDGQLSSWLAAPDAARRHARAYQTFSATRRAYG